MITYWAKSTERESMHQYRGLGSHDAVASVYGNSTTRAHQQVDPSYIART